MLQMHERKRLRQCTGFIALYAKGARGSRHCQKREWFIVEACYLAYSG